MRPIDEQGATWGIITAMIAKDEFPGSELALQTVIERLGIEVAEQDQQVADRLLERVNTTSAGVRIAQERIAELKGGGE